MSDLALRSRLPGPDIMALIGIAVGFALAMIHWMGYVILPLALLLPFVLRELDLVPDDERVRDAWRRAGFWAFAMFVAQAALIFGLDGLTAPESGYLVALAPHNEYVVVIRGPVIVFAAVFLASMGETGAGARWVLLGLGAIAALLWAGNVVATGLQNGWEWVFRGDWWYLPAASLGLASLGFLAARRPRLAGGSLLGCTAVGVAHAVIVRAPRLAPSIETHGMLPLRLDDRFVFASYLSTYLALAVVAFLLLRSPRGESP
jgi:uncharacterized membrane protein